MERQIIYDIPIEYSGHKISEFLRGKGYSQQSLTTIRQMPDSIMIGDRAQHLNYHLEGGETLTVHIIEKGISEKIPPVELPFPIIYEDEDLVVVNKPAGMPIHPSMNHYENTLGNAAAYYYAAQGKDFIYRCINRLDRDTTGLTIIAKNMISCGILYSEMAMRKINREYLAIVEGTDLAADGTIDMPIGRKQDTAIERMIDYEQGERAVTHYHVLERGSNISLILLHLDTGRTHQIRVHMAAIGHPLIGDFLYNPGNHLMTRQALHSATLSFTHPITQEAMHLTAAMPEDMRYIMNGGDQWNEY